MSLSPVARPQQQTFRPPLVSFLFSLAWWGCAYQLYLWGQQGWEWGTLICMAAAGMAVRQTIKAMDDRVKVKIHRRKKEKFAKEAKQHAQSRLATSSDIKQCEFLSSTEGVFCGSHVSPQGKTQDTFYNGQQSISCFAPPGEHKTTGLIIPTLLANPVENLIINDPTGECYAICKNRLERQGYNVQVLTSFASRLSDRLRVPVVDAGLDIFSSFHAKMDPMSIRSELIKIMKWVCPDKSNMDAKDGFFIQDAIELGSFFALTDLRHQYKPTLPSMRTQLMQGMHNLVETFSEAAECSDFGGVYAELAQSLGGILQQAPQQFAGAFGVLKQHIDAYDSYSLLGQHTSGEGFDPKVLKHPTQKTALFLISGLEMMETMAPTTAMTLMYLFNSIAADTQQGRCTALIDECGSLTGLSGLPSALEFYRKANLRCVMIWQDMAQAERNFGKAAMKQILAASKLKIFMGIQDQETLELASKLCGTASFESLSLTDRSMMTDPMPDLSQGLGFKTVPLLRPEEIRTMSQMLVVGGNLHPLVLNKVPYFTRSAWRKAASRSPFYHG